MARCLCLAVCLAALALAAEAQDVSALVQSAVRTHRERNSRRSSGGLGGLVDAAFRSVAGSAARARQAARKDEKPGLSLDPEELQEMELETHDAFTRASGKIAFHRLDSRASVDGAFAVFNAQKVDCRECLFKWGEQLELLSVVHVPTFIMKGDKVNIQVDVTMDVKNLADPLSGVFMGDTYTLLGHCEICDGSCHLHSTKDMDAFSLTIPTLIRDSDTCDGPNPLPNLTDVVLMDKAITLPPIDMSWLQMDGFMNVSLTMNRENQELTSTAVSFTFNSAEGWQEKGSAPERKTMLVDGDSKPESGKVGELSEVPGLLQVDADSSPSEGKESLDEEEEDSVATGMLRALLLGDYDAHPDVKTVNAIRTGVTVHELENYINNISLRIVNGGMCQGGKLGSMDCVMKFGESHIYSTHLALSATLDQGSYLLVSVTPKVEGVLGNIWHKMIDQFKFEDLELPACGESYDFQIHDEWHRWTPGPCGHYALKMDAPHKEMLVSTAAIASPAYRVYKRVIPGMKLNFALLPPLTFNIRVKVLHYGAVPIADLEFNMGLKKEV